MEDLSIYIVGSAGEGIQTVGDVVSLALLRNGIRVFASQEFESRIRGGNSSYRIRASGPNAPRHTADVLVSLNPSVMSHYENTACPDCLRLGELPPGGQGISIPFQKLAKEEFGSPIVANSIAAGALGALLGLSETTMEAVVRQHFAKLKDEALHQNLTAVRLGYKKAREQPGASLSVPLAFSSRSFVFASAHEVLPLAAAAAGCRFMAAYPMSPSTGIMTLFAKHPELGVFVEQAEDEIAAINMCLGASAAGARAMTATSGGGFSLMAEGVSLAGMTETPLVIVLAQRPGPATGLPTRTAQEDLLFAIYSGHGEFPRAVLAPSDPQSAVHAVQRAFDLADRYQIPVIVLTDQLLADSRFSLPDLDIPNPDGPASFLAHPGEIDVYLRYAITEDGISPRLALGQSQHLVIIDSDEHTEEGHITEDLVSVRPAMVEKRLEKLRCLHREMALPEAYRTEGADIVLMGWGSTREAVREAVDDLRTRGLSVGALHLTELWPLPSLSLPRTVAYWSVEGNATGQLAHLLQAEWGFPMAGRIGRYDGLPLDAASIVTALTGLGEEDI